MAVSCSHGTYLDPKARDAILAFKKQLKPAHVIHLGDFVDLTALRSGASGTSDEAADLTADFEAGLGFLKEYGATLVFQGNHEARAFHMRHHFNAIKAKCANDLCTEIEKVCKELRAELVPYHVQLGWRHLGNWGFGHGYMFSESCARDHAESFGNTVFGHAHRCAYAKGRRIDNPTAICVGTLTNIPNMDYASTRRSTLAWSAGFAWGYTDKKRTVAWLHEQPNDQSEWILPR